MSDNGTRSEPALTTTIGELIEAHPEVMEVLEDFGIRLDPWTMIALKSTVQELAEYSAIRRPEELREAIGKRMAAEASHVEGRGANPGSPE